MKKYSLREILKMIPTERAYWMARELNESKNPRKLSETEEKAQEYIGNYLVSTRDGRAISAGIAAANKMNQEICTDRHAVFHYPGAAIAVGRYALLEARNKRHAMRTKLKIMAVRDFLEDNDIPHLTIGQLSELVRDINREKFVEALKKDPEYQDPNALLGPTKPRRRKSLPGHYFVLAQRAAIIQMHGKEALLSMEQRHPQGYRWSLRKELLEIKGIDNTVRDLVDRFVCSDHFVLEEDLRSIVAALVHSTKEKA